MTAPVKPENPTQPLPIPGTETLPGGGNWLMSEHSVMLVVPGAPLAAWVVGELVLRPFVLLGDETRSDFAIIGLLVLFIGSFVVFVRSRSVGRGKDGRS